MNRLLFSLLFSLMALTAFSQRIEGTITDARTGERLAFANVYYERGATTQSNINGDYFIEFKQRKLTVSLVGYKTQTFRLTAARRLDIRLEPSSENELGEAVVKGRKDKYSRKNNPAVDLMRKVIAAKKESDLRQHDYYSYDKYSKLTFALNNVSEKMFTEGILKRFSVLQDNVETCNETGKRILPVSIDETVSQEIYRRQPRSEKSIVQGKQTTGFNTLFNTGDLLTEVLNDCFADVNIYEDNIRLLKLQFISPLGGNTAINFYRYFIVDTLDMNGEKTIELNFTPNNPQDVGFSGALYIAADSTYRVVKADLTLPKKSDVNYVDNMRIIQDFKRLESGEQFLVRDDMIVEMQVVSFVQALMVRRITENSNLSFAALPDKTFKFRGDKMTAANATIRPAEFWRQYRANDPMSESEERMQEIMGQVGQVKGFRGILWVAKAFIENFVETTTDPKKGSKFDVGPVNTTFSYNFVDGFRLRAGGQTTANLNPHLFFRGYVAYGFKDRRVKGLGEVTYSFLPKAYLPREFPVNNLTFTYNNDVMAPSDRFLPTDKDNVFTSLKWTKVNHMLYYTYFRLLWDREWENNLRLNVRLNHEKDEPTAALFYQPLDGRGAPSNDPSRRLHHLNTTDLTLSLTFQPGATWMNTKQRRYMINKDVPVFSLSHTIGLRGVLGSDYTYNLTEASIYKRFWLGSWGKIETRLAGGVQWNKVPYPLLIMPRANLSYILQTNMFNLINNMEFLNDRYASLMLSWDFNGKIFNRIPLLKHLKWREYIGCNMLWGTLTDKNNPTLARHASDNKLFYFPGEFQPDGSFRYLSSVMDKRTPYIEVFAGVHNIFKILHVEYVRRLTYLNIPKRHQWGIRAMLRVSF